VLFVLVGEPSARSDNPADDLAAEGSGCVQHSLRSDGQNISDDAGPVELVQRHDRRQQECVIVSCGYSWSTQQGFCKPRRRQHSRRIAWIFKQPEFDAWRYVCPGTHQRNRSARVWCVECTSNHRNIRTVVARADTANRKQQQVRRWGSGLARGHACAGDRKSSQGVFKPRPSWQRKCEMQIWMVLQIASDTGTIESRCYADFLQFISRPDAGTQQYCRRMYCARAQNNLARSDFHHFAGMIDAHAFGL